MTFGGMQVAMPEHDPSHDAWTEASTSQCPADTASVHSACALAVRMPLILVDAWLQASVGSASGALPSVGFLAVHVSATLRSVSMATQAFRTPVSMSPATLTRFAAAVRKALVSPSTITLATDDAPPLNSLQPCAAPAMADAALHPPLDIASKTTDPTSSNAGAYFILRLFMKALLGRQRTEPRGGTDRLDHLRFDEATSRTVQFYGGAPGKGQLRASPFPLAPSAQA